jgi:putative ABC transport system permease protein
MEAAMARSAAPRRFPLLLVGLFAGIALVLAVVGLHGILSQWVAERRSELAVRMALGASPGRVASLVLGNALAIAASGLAGGVAVSAALGRWMETLVFGVSPFDALVYGLSALLLLAVVMAASGVPGWRAARVLPMDALRQG